MKNKISILPKLIPILVVCIFAFPIIIDAYELRETTAGPSREPAFENPRQEYGQSESLIEQGQALYSCMLYPKTGLVNVDGSISKWANELNETFKNDAVFSHQDNSLATGELSTNYNSYLMGERYAGIEILGFRTNGTAENATAVVKTFNISIEGKRIISNNEIISEKDQEDALALLKIKILRYRDDLADHTQAMDPSWLENMVLTHEGIKVILEKGKYLPESFGTQAFVLTYDELGSVFKLPRRYFSGIRPKLPVDPEKPMVALTFDDGPGKATEKILDLLEQYDARATFCVLGNRVSKYEETIARAAKSGNEIIGHSWDHKQLTRLSNANIKKQLEDTNNAIFSITGIMPAFHRPPYGSVNSNVKKITKDLNMSMVNWSVDPYDWKTKDAAATYSTIMDHVENGSIILCHDIHEATGEAMEQVIPDLIEQGYQLVTVSELLSHREIPVEYGGLYYSLTR